MPIERFNDAMVTAFAAFQSKNADTFEAAVNAAEEAVRLTGRDALTQQEVLKCLNTAIESFPTARALFCLSEAANIIASTASYSHPPGAST